MTHARSHGAGKHGGRHSGGSARRRSRVFRPWPESDDAILEVRVVPASLSIIEGGLAYIAADGEANRLAVDVVQVGGQGYIRFRELGGVAISVDGAGLVSDSASVARAPLTGFATFDIVTLDGDDTMSLVLDPALPGPIAIDLGPATTTNAMTLLGTAGNDAVALAPLLTSDGSKVIDVTSGGLKATLKLRGTLSVDLSQPGQDSLTVDRGISNYGRMTGLNVIGGGAGDTLHVTAPGSNPQTFVLSDGQVQLQSAGGGSEIVLGRSDNIAIDQPKVTVEVIHLDAQGNETSLGPSTFNTFLLDTGATSVLSAAEATTELKTNDSGLPYQTLGQYDEQGVAGTNLWDVSAPYRLDFAGNSGVRNTLQNVQILSSEDNSFSFLGPWGIVGMPAMVGRVTTLDLTGWSTLQDPLDLSMKVEFSADPLPPNVHTYSVPLTLHEFPADGQIGNGPIPTMAPLPFVQVEVRDGDHQASGQFLVDTGAQLSMLSTAKAIALGLDKNGNGSLDDEAVDFIEVGGVGGTVLVPLVPFQQASITTDQGPKLTWANMLVGVLDIVVEDGPQIDGIFGMDYLTSGWAAKVLPQLTGEPGADEDGFFQHIGFDFRNAAQSAGSLILDVTPSRDSLHTDLAVNYSGINVVNVTGSSGDDNFLVSPSATISYTINGGAQATADILNLVPAGLSVTDDGSTAQIAGYQDIHYTGIEQKNFGESATAGTTLSPTGGLVTTEAGGTATFTVVLNARPIADVTIPLSSSDTSEGTVSPASLTFTQDNWNVPRTVTVTGVDDAVEDGNVAYSIVLGPAVSNDSAYNGLNPADVGVTNTDDDTFQVASITATPTGFVARFNQPIDLSTLNLYDTASGALGPADATLVGATVGTVRGSLIPSPDGLSVTFLRTGGLLAADTYQVVLRSAANAFRTAAGEPIDGDGDGVAGGDFTASFTVDAPAAGTVVVGLPDFARGQTQAVNVPASAAGLPIRLSDGNGVTAVSLELHYNANLLSITGITALPEGSSATLDTSTPGVAIITFDSPALPAGAQDIVRLTASIPADAPYSAKQVLSLTDLVVEAGSTVLPALPDDAIHAATYLGDLNGDGRITSGDATLLRRVIVGIDQGFAGAQLADPRSAAVGDLNGNGSVDSGDLTQIRRYITNQTTNFIPPRGPDISSVPGPDPLVFIPDNLQGSPGQVITVPVKLAVNGEDGVDVAGLDLAIHFDASKFSASNVRLGGLVAQGPDGFDAPFAIIDQAGTIQLTAMSRSGNGVALPDGTAGDLLLIDLTIRPDAPPGPASLNLMGSMGNLYVNLSNSRGTSLRLTTAPTDTAADTGVDGVLTIAPAAPVEPIGIVPGGKAGSGPVAAGPGAADPPAAVTTGTSNPDPMASGVGKLRRTAARRQRPKGGDGVAGQRKPAREVPPGSRAPGGVHPGLPGQRFAARVRARRAR
ncbi:MAG: cohesin domain-containing protein [Isosphaeraceae bacterium]